MPAVSKKQQRFFGYLLSNPDERKKRGISKKAAKDFAKSVDESIERQAKDRKKLSQPHSVSGSRRDHSHDVDSALTDHVPRKGKGRIRPASKKEMRVSAMRDAGIKQEEVVYEVSPPGWGHTKAEKEKTKPWKPKSKIGGTAAAFKRALDDGRFKGLPGSKTKKEKTADMFKLMWSMKKKGDHPHYKPGTDKKYKKYQKNEEKQITSMQDNDLFGNAYERSGASWRISKKKKKKKTQSEEAQTRYWKDDPKTKKSWAQFTNSMRKAAANKAQSDKTAVDTAKRGVKFYDKKGSGRIVKGKKVYGAK